MKFKKYLNNNSGFTLVELAIVTAIATTSLSVGLWKMTEDAKIDKGYALADQLKTISSGVENYISTYYGQLASAVPVVAGFADPMQPTMAELKADGKVNVGISDTNIYGSGYAIILSKDPAGCIPPNCNVNGLVSITDPITQPSSGAVDGVVLGAASQRLGGDSAVSYNAASFEGAGGGWTVANPLGKAGLLAIRNGSDASSLSGFYRRDGSLELTGDLAGGGKNINDVVDVNATGKIDAATANVTGTVTAANVKVPAGNNLQVGNSYYYGDGSNSAVRQSGSFYVQHTDSSAADIAAVRNISSSGSISAAGNVTASGIIAQSFTDSNNGGYYVDPNGTSRMNYAVVDNLQAYGNVAANGNVTANGEVHGTHLVSLGTMYGVTNTWGMQLLDAGWGGNSAPQSAVGSAHVNDIYLRSIGKWASQIAAPQATVGIYTLQTNRAGIGQFCYNGNPYTGGCSCPAGTWSSFITQSVHPFADVIWWMYQCIR